MTISCVQHGYERCGQYPLDFTKTMAKCSGMNEVSGAQCAQMKATIEHFVGIFRTKSELTEEDMNKEKIFHVKEKHKKPKDQRVLYQQRAVLLNKEETIAKFKIYKSNKEIAAAKKAANATQGDKRKRKVDESTENTENAQVAKKPRTRQPRNTPQ